MGQEKYYRYCAVCGNKWTYLDARGMRWCDEHRFRSEFLAWGEAHQYMALDTPSYKLAEGEFFWRNLAYAGHETAVYTFLAYIEWLEDQWAKEKTA